MHLLFIDSSVNNYQNLIAAAKPGTEVVVLDSTRDGVEQITEVLSQKQGVETVEIVSHGGEGMVQLGAGVLSNDNLQDYRSQLQQWRNALTENADILFYGCNVAAGENGVEFVRQLSELTGADIAASEDLTGNSDLEGDWDLEVVTGEIEAETAISQEAQESFTEILPVTVEYFDGTKTSEGNVERTEFRQWYERSELQNFQKRDWGNRPPYEAWEVGKDDFALRWLGYIYADKSGTYTFYEKSDDGVRLWVNNRQIIDEWKRERSGIDTNSGSITLEAGKWYPIQMDYFELGGDAEVELKWQPPGESRQDIPDEKLIPLVKNSSADLGYGLKGEYFNNDYLGGKPSHTQIDTAINFDWGDKSPVEGTVNNDYFSVRWTGSIIIPEDGWYKFSTEIDDRVWLYINNQQVIKREQYENKIDYSKALYFSKGQAVPITLDYAEVNSTAKAKLFWEATTQKNGGNKVLDRTFIPATSLIPYQPGERSVIGVRAISGSEEAGTAQFEIAALDKIPDGGINVFYKLVPLDGPSLGNFSDTKTKPGQVFFTPEQNRETITVENISDDNLGEARKLRIEILPGVQYQNTPSRTVTIVDNEPFVSIERLQNPIEGKQHGLFKVIFDKKPPQDFNLYFDNLIKPETELTGKAVRGTVANTKEGSDYKLFYSYELDEKPDDKLDVQPDNRKYIGDQNNFISIIKDDVQQDDNGQYYLIIGAEVVNDNVYEVDNNEEITISLKDNAITSADGYGVNNSKRTVTVQIQDDEPTVSLGTFVNISEGFDDGSTLVNLESALKLTGNNSVTVPADESLNLNQTGQFTQEAWIFSTVNDDGEYGILGSGSDNQSYPGMWLYNQTGIKAGFGDGTDWNNFTVENVLNQNQWNHVATSFDGNEYRLYVNGNLVDTTLDFAGKKPYQTQQLTIGEASGKKFQGQIDEVRLWNVARSYEQIQENVIETLKGSEEGLVGYWQFNNNTDDSSVNQNNGTLQGGTDNDYIYNPLPQIGYVEVNLDKEVNNPIGLWVRYNLSGSATRTDYFNSQVRRSTGERPLDAIIIPNKEQAGRIYFTARPDAIKEEDEQIQINLIPYNFDGQNSDGSYGVLGNADNSNYKVDSSNQSRTITIKDNNAYQPGVVIKDQFERIVDQNNPVQAQAVAVHTNVPGEITVSSNNSPFREEKEKAFDNSSGTKWLIFDNQGWIQYQFNDEQPRLVNEYRITSANDFPSRDPKNWILQGSNDGENWIDIDKRTNQFFNKRFQTKSFEVNSNQKTPYQYYRLNVEANNGGRELQIAEFQLLGGVSNQSLFDLTNLVGTAIASNNQSPLGEGKQQAFDDKISTKWLISDNKGYLQYKFDNPNGYILNQYTITSANNEPNNDPKEWVLEASSNGVNWIELDNRSNETFSERFQTKSFTVDNQKTYQYYRLNVKANNGGSELQLAELQLIGPLSNTVVNNSRKNFDITFQLSSQPQSNVTVELTNLGNLTTTKSRYTVKPEDWDKPQPISVDNITADGKITARLTSSDANYNKTVEIPFNARGKLPNLEATEGDPRDKEIIPLVRITPVDKLINEGANQNGQFLVELSDAAPKDGLTVVYSISGTGDRNEEDDLIAVQDKDYELIDDKNLGELRIAPGEKTASISFNILDDNIDETKENVAVNLSQRPGYILDSTFNSAVIDIEDNDAAGIEIVNVNNFTGEQGETREVIATSLTPLTTSEDGTQAVIALRLNSQPQENVTVFFDDINNAETEFSSTELIFDENNWNQNQKVTIYGVDDNITDGDVSYQIAVKTNSNDPFYRGIGTNIIEITNRDNDSGFISVQELNDPNLSEAERQAKIDAEVLKLEKQTEAEIKQDLGQDVDLDFTTVNNSGPNASISTNFVVDDFNQDVRSDLLSADAAVVNDIFSNTDGKALFFIGEGTRQAVTNPLDVSNGGTVNFDLIFGNTFNVGDNTELGEDVVLEYSIDGGQSFTVFKTYDTEEYTSWTTINETIPQEAQTQQTLFRIRQVLNSASTKFPNVDNWGLDNFKILELREDSNSTKLTVNLDAPASEDVFIKYDVVGGNAIQNKDYKITGGNFALLRQIGNTNPLNGFDVGENSSIDFADLNGDGLVDALGVGANGTINYYQNNGTQSSPLFISKVGVENPFDGINLTNGFINIDDLNNDGLADIVLGQIASEDNISTIINVVSEDFNNGVNSEQLSTIATANNNFVNTNGSALFFTGNGIRQVVTKTLDVSGGGNVTFDLTFGNSSNGGEDADAGEDVVLEYSIDKGQTFTVLKTYDTEDYTSWTTINENIPVEAQTQQTQFRWRQVRSNGGSFDQWALDNINISSTKGILKYYENTSSAEQPLFTQLIGTENPFNDIERNSTPALADIDDDGLTDLVVKTANSGIKYYKNTGTSDKPIFTEQTGDSNPFSNLNGQPAFADLDKDGDLDLALGAADGTLKYYRNDSGTFTEQAGGNNPFVGFTFDVGENANPVFVDLNNDQHQDLVVGNADGTFATFINLPGIRIAEGETSANIEITPINDDIDEDVENIKLQLFAGTNYRLNPDAPDSFATEITLADDNDTAGITITPLQTKTETSETGDFLNYELKLNSQPVAPVSVFVGANKPGEAKISSQPPSVDNPELADYLALEFTPQNWDTPQKFTVVGVDDRIDDGGETDKIPYQLLTTVESQDRKYHKLKVAPIDLVNIDDDLAGININLRGDAGNLEEGTTNVFTVSLKSQPTDEVNVTVVPGDDQIVLNGQKPRREVVLTFDEKNWDKEQVVRVVAVDDGLVEYDHQSQISFKIDSENDQVYNDKNSELIPEPVTVNIKDNDLPTAKVVPGWTASELQGAPSGFMVYLSHTAPKQTGDTGIKVNYEIIGGSATYSTDTTKADYQPIAKQGSVTIAPGDIQNNLLIVPIDDKLVEKLSLKVQEITNENLNNGTINLNLVPTRKSAKILVEENFNNGNLNHLLTFSYQINNKFSKTDGQALFFGYWGTRQVATKTLDVSEGGSLSFDLIFGNDSNGGENADEGDDVVLEYSIDGGQNFTVLKTYDTEDYTSWTTINETIPVEARTQQTQFRWRQVVHSNTGWFESFYRGLSSLDNWGLDNVKISANNPFKLVKGTNIQLAGGLTAEIINVNTTDTAVDIQVQVKPEDKEKIGQVTVGSIAEIAEETVQVRLLPGEGYKLGSDKTEATLGIIDDDEPGVRIIEFGDHTTVIEDQTATFQISLLSEPTENVVININNPERQVRALNQTLTFTPQNWYKLQTVKIEGIDEAVVEEGDFHSTYLQYTVTSGDNVYNDFAIADQLINVIDRLIDKQEAIEGVTEGLRSASEILNNLEVPLIGSADGKVPNITEGLDIEVAAAIDGTDNLTTAKLEEILENALHNYEISLKDFGIDSVIKPFEAVDVIVEMTSDDLKVQFELSDTYNLFNVALDADLGLPALGLETDGSISSYFDYTFGLGFGFHKDFGFYIDTENTKFEAEIAAILGEGAYDTDDDGNYYFQPNSSGDDSEDEEETEDDSDTEDDSEIFINELQSEGEFVFLEDENNGKTYWDKNNNGQIDSEDEDVTDDDILSFDINGNGRLDKNLEAKANLWLLDFDVANDSENPSKLDIGFDVNLADDLTTKINFVDINGNGNLDFTDNNNNGIWDKGEPFTEPTGKVKTVKEKNSNNTNTSGEKTTVKKLVFNSKDSVHQQYANNATYVETDSQGTKLFKAEVKTFTEQPVEVFLDVNFNGEHDAGEPIGVGIEDENGEYILNYDSSDSKHKAADTNNDGNFDVEIAANDPGHGYYVQDGSIRYFDFNLNGELDYYEPSTNVQGLQQFVVTKNTDFSTDLTYYYFDSNNNNQIDDKDYWLIQDEDTVNSTTTWYFDSNGDGEGQNYEKLDETIVEHLSKLASEIEGDFTLQDFTTKLEGTFVTADDGDRLTASEITKIFKDRNISFKDLISYNLGGEANLGLEMQASIEGDAAFPSIGTNLAVNYPIFNYGNQEEAEEQKFELAFNDLTLDLGGFITNFAKPVFDSLNDLFEPIRPVIDVLNADTGVLIKVFPEYDDDSDDKLTLIEFFAGIAYDNDVRSLIEPLLKKSGISYERFQKSISTAKTLIDLFTQVDAVVQEIAAFEKGENITIDLGSYSLDDIKGASEDSENSTAEDTDLGSGNNPNLAANPATQTIEQQANQKSSKGASLLNKLSNVEGLDFELLNPITILRILLGEKDVDLLTFDVPDLDLTVPFSTGERVLGYVVPPGLEVTGRFDAEFGVNTDLFVGFDTRGLELWAESDFAVGDSYKIFDGFYLRDGIDENGDGILQPEEDSDELGLSALAQLSLSANAYIAKLTGYGGLEGRAGLDVVDGGERNGTNDGKIRFSEVGEKLAKAFSGELGSNVGRILTEFIDLSGVLEAFFGIEVKVGISVFGFEIMQTVYKDELGRFTIFEFDLADLVSDTVIESDTSTRNNAGRVGSTDNTVLVAENESNTENSEELEESEFGQILPTKGNDTLEGTAEQDIIDGDEGNDVIDGKFGNDEIFGRNGNDTLTGGAGNDFVYGGNGDDQIQGATGNDNLYGENGNDFINGDEGNDVIDGKTGDDLLIGGKGNDTLTGGEGNDSLEGNFGNDVLNGELGNDILEGAAGNDTIYGGDGMDKIEGAVGKDELFGDNGADNISGGSGNDTLTGGAGNDVLLGNSGDDVLIGSAGDDVLTGGTGKDVFKLLSIQDGYDKITDFDVNEDKVFLDLQTLGISVSEAQNALSYNNKGILLYNDTELALIENNGLLVEFSIDKHIQFS